MLLDDFSAQNLSNDYAALSSQPRLVVQVYALLFEPSSRDKAMRCFNEVTRAIPRLKLKALDTKDFSIQVTQLLNQGLLVLVGGTPRCPMDLMEVATQDALKENLFEPIAQAVTSLCPIRKGYLPNVDHYFSSEGEFVRELRLAFYRQDQPKLDKLYKEVKHAYWKPTFRHEDLVLQIVSNPFNAEWFNTLGLPFRQQGISLMLTEAGCYGLGSTPIFNLLETDYQQGIAGADLQLDYVEQLWLRGQLREAISVLAQISNKTQPARYYTLLGALAFLQGEYDSALSHYRLGLKAAGKSKAAQAKWFEQPAAMLFLLTLLKDHSVAALQELDSHLQLLAKQDMHWLMEVADTLSLVVRAQQGLRQRVAGAKAETLFMGHEGLAGLLESYCLYWLGCEGVEPFLQTTLVAHYQTALYAQFTWVALEICELLSHLRQKASPALAPASDKPSERSPASAKAKKGTATKKKSSSIETDSDNFAEKAIILRKEVGSQPFLDIVTHKEWWELSLEALSNLGQPVGGQPTAIAPQEAEFRMAWSLRYYAASNCDITPLEQKYSVKGGWTKGKNIALKRLLSTADRPSYLTPQDHQVCDKIEVEYEQTYYYGATKQLLSFGDSALLALVGHPLIFWEDNPGVRIEVLAGEPELRIKRLPNHQLSLEFSPPLLQEREIVIWKETPTRLKVVAITAQHRQIASILGPKNKLEVPARAEEQVLAAIASITNMVTVQSDMPHRECIYCPPEKG
jgi:tetratricopeptide (TPR) repeat protein